MGVLQLLAKENYIAYNKILARIVGVDEAILFGELCSMCNLYGEEFFCEQSRLMEDTCLTEYRVRNALKNLQSVNLVAIVKKGLPAKNYYTLNEEVLLEILTPQSTSGVKSDTTRNNESAATSEGENDSTFNKNTRSKNTRSKNTGSKNTEKEDILTEFDILWKLYPRKIGKTKAFADYEKARKKGVTFEQVKQGIENYLKQIKAKKTSVEYIKHGSTWFGNEGWNDEYDFTSSTDGKPRYGNFDADEAFDRALQRSYGDIEMHKSEETKTAANDESIRERAEALQRIIQGT